MNKINEPEMIARQAIRIEEMGDELTRLQADREKVRAILYSIGGPLNDNYDQYSPHQLRAFFSIAKCCE